MAVNGLVVAADGAGALVRAGVLGPEIAGVVGVFLLFFSASRSMARRMKNRMLSSGDMAKSTRRAMVGMRAR